MVQTLSNRAAADGLLARRVALNAAAQLVPLLVQLVLTPFVVGTLGLDAFGLWSLVLVFVGTLSTLDGGVGASLTRFLAIHAALDARKRAGTLLFGAALVFLFVAALVTALGNTVGPLLIGLLHLPIALQGDAEIALRLLGLPVLLALLNGAVVSVLQANQKFSHLVAAVGSAQAAYVVVVVALLQPTSSITVLILALTARYIVGIAVGAVVARRLIRFSRPMLPPPGERREFVRYAGRMQLSSLTSLLNGEVDALAIAALLPVRYVGIFAAAHQIAMAARSIPLFALPPVLTTVSAAFAGDGHPGAVREFDHLQPRWLPAVLGYTAVAATTAVFALPAWLGPDFTLSGTLAAVLVAGYGIHAALTGIRTCLVRSVGRPGLETKYSIVSTIINLALTVPLAMMFGVIGVVVATAVALISSSVYFVRICQPIGLHDHRPAMVWIPATIAGVALTVGGQLALSQLNWTGPAGIAACGAVALTGLCATFLLARRQLVTRPT